MNIEVFLILNIGSILVDVSFDIATHSVISASHFASDANMRKRYLNLCTFLIGSPLQLMLHMGICFFCDNHTFSLIYIQL